MLNVEVPVEAIGGGAAQRLFNGIAVGRCIHDESRWFLRIELRGGVGECAHALRDPLLPDLFVEVCTSTKSRQGGCSGIGTRPPSEHKHDSNRRHVTLPESSRLWIGVPPARPFVFSRLNCAPPHVFHLVGSQLLK